MLPGWTRKPALLVLLSAILYLAAFPLLSWWWFVFIALAPFFRALAATPLQKDRLLLGVLWGAVVGMGMGYWVLPTLIGPYHVSIPLALVVFPIAVIIPMVLIWGSFALLYGAFYQDRLSFHALFVPSIWCLFEYGKELIPFLIPWGPPGLALVPCAPFIRIADLGGGYLVTFIVVLINALLCLLAGRMPAPGPDDAASVVALLSRIRRTMLAERAATLLLAAACILPFVYGIIDGAVTRASVASELRAGHGVTVRIAQGNFAPERRWEEESFFERVEAYLALSTDLGARAADLVIWPETVLNSSGKIDRYLFATIARRLGEKTHLIAGGIRLDRSRNAYNTAYSFSSSGKVSKYDKNVLLPYAETSPIGNTLGAAYEAPAKFEAGWTPPVLPTGYGPAGISICFEVLYGWHVRGSVKQGARFLVNISNDAWFGDTAEPVVQYFGARMRAVELRRFMLRGSECGISAIIAPDGTPVARSSLFKREHVQGTMVPLQGKTLYALLGDWVVFLAAAVLGWFLVRELMRPIEPELSPEEAD